MTTPATRRTVLAGIATAVAPLPALGDSIATSSDDPIHAAIAAHTAATMEMLRAGAASGNLLMRDPGWAPAEAANVAAAAAWNAETENLVNVKPTTRAGVLALLEHVVRFDRGLFTLGSVHHTEALMWPEIDDDSPYGIPFGNRLLHTVHEALANGVA